MKIFGFIVLALLFLGAAGYFFVVKPAIDALQENKPIALERVTSYVNCITDDNQKNCREQFMTEEAQKVTNSEGLQLLGKKIKSKLGKRLIASIDEKSVRANKNYNTDGITTTISFSAKVSYEKDPAVTENCVLVKKGTDPFLIQSFTINSNELLR